MRWIQANWDKVLGFFLTIILSGTIGFFSAVIAMRAEVNTARSDVAKVEQRVVAIETELNTSLRAKALAVDSLRATTDAQFAAVKPLSERVASAETRVHNVETQINAQQSLTSRLSLQIAWLMDFATDSQKYFGGLSHRMKSGDFAEWKKEAVDYERWWAIITARQPH